jgi:hypothetical protein
MTKVVLDPTFAGQLAGFTAPVELCDPDGRLLGQFVPTVAQPFVLRPEDNCPYSAEELKQLLANGETMTLQDFWKTLEQA